MKLITETLLNTVSGQAKENPRLRMNYNFHESTIMQKGIYYSGLPCGTIGIQGRCQTS